MNKYFDGMSMEESGENAIEKISERFMLDNPVTPYSYRAYNSLGFIRDNRGRSVLDFDEKFPNAEDGDYAFAFAKFYSETDGLFCLSLSCKNRNEIYINGEFVTKTTCQDEVLNDERTFDFQVHKGYNTVFIKSKKGVLGFKCIIGCYSPKWLPVNFYTAFSDNDGELGWNYCGVCKSGDADIPKIGDKMTEKWLPKPESNQPYLYDKTAYVLSFIDCAADGKVEINYNTENVFRAYSDGKFIFDGSGSGAETVKLTAGIHKLAFECDKLTPKFEIKVNGAKLFLPQHIKGVRGNFLYLETDDTKAREGFDEYRLYGKKDEKTFFKCGENSYIRPVLERSVSGKSNYPIGVALYGMLVSGIYAKNEQVCRYVHNNIMQCCQVQEYAEWDCKMFGSACVNHQLLHLSALDDCGSYASTMLEDYITYSHDERILPIANYIGNYILNKQERLENGAFYREMPGEFFQYTVWADDLYMSTPFMIRYSKVIGDPSILDDAVNQFLHFKELLFMPDKKLMSHVYNLKFKMQTKVPWGRGNGWVLFSLSELLRVLPETHKSYNSIKAFFVELCEGFLAIIDSVGMCHQVLDDHESYAEASCTAMCAAAFARGVMLGILDEKYSDAAKKAVDALLKYCVDSDGNIYGVCVGSGYSFTRDYYKYDLPWNINDTHGTGIVLIAVTETEKLRHTGAEADMPCA